MAEVALLPDSVQVIAGIVGVAVAAGTVVIGWVRAKGTQPTTNVEAAMGIVDNRGVKALVESIDGAVESFDEFYQKDNRARKDMRESLDRLCDELSDLNAHLGRLVRQNALKD
jgi:hypothetical protein